jgi:hypothetical protein
VSSNTAKEKVSLSENRTEQRRQAHGALHVHVRIVPVVRFLRVADSAVAAAAKQRVGIQHDAAMLPGDACDNGTIK